MAMTPEEAAKMCKAQDKDLVEDTKATATAAADAAELAKLAASAEALKKALSSASD